MLELYLRLLIAGFLSMMLTTLGAQFFVWLKFVVVGWRITKPPEARTDESQYLPEGSSLPELSYTFLMYVLSLAVFVFSLFKIDLPTLPDSLKAVISLSIAQTAYTLPMLYGSFRESFRRTEGWAYLLVPLYLILTVAVGSIICVPILALLFGWFAYNLIRSRTTQETQFLRQVKESQSSMLENFETLTSPQRLLYADVVSSIVLAGAYWLFGFRENWLLFVAPAFLLVLANRMFSNLLVGMRRPEEPAQLRAVNPVAFAGTLIILFSFYIALLLGRPERTAIYLIASALFLLALWYFCYLSRRETTIEVARNSYASKDYDFQIDSSNGMLTIFSRLIWFLHPVFFALGLHRSGGQGGSLFVEAWFDSMKVVLVMVLVYALTCLFIWTRNIREPKLGVAGEGRPDYPEYRDNLAASALPYCVIIPALVYAFLNLMGLSPIRLPGLDGNIWLDIAIYAALMLTLMGLFIQLPYRGGARAWKSPKIERLEKQIEQIKINIEDRRDDLLKSRSSVVAMKNISDELTLYRLRNEADNENKGKKLTYNITWPGEIARDSALYFILSFVASAITTAIATNLDAITKLLLKIPK